MKPRFRIFIAINVLAVITWLVYLFNIQILNSFDFTHTINIRQNPSKKLIHPYRGNIFDRNKRLLVSSTKYYQLDIDRKLAIKKCKTDSERKAIFEKIAKIFAENTKLKTNVLIKKLMKKPFESCVYISSEINETEFTKIKASFKEEDIKGLVHNFSSIKRSYPLNKLASRLLGLTSSNINDNNDKIFSLDGKCGLEATYNNELSGDFGWEENVHDAKNKVIPYKFLREKKPTNGNSLVLTIDSNFQEILETSLKSGIIKYEAKKAMGIIMEVNSGEIYALAGIDKEDKKRYPATLRAMSNLPVSFMFEPGSTLKPITALLAIEKGIGDSNEKIDCRDYHLEYNETKRTITDSHEHNKLTLRDIIAFSSNVGISKIVEKVGNNNLYNRLLGLGFGHKTGSNIHGEASGIFRKLEDWQGFSLHSISFGQEIAVTTLQLANAYCALANGGKVLQPTALKEIQNEKGEIVKSIKPKVLRTISDKNSLDTLKVFLQSVVDYGSATSTKLENLNIAGKTGTAEKLINGENKYSEEKYTSIFAGFFPVEKPKFTIVIVYDEPRYDNYSYYGSVSAVPTFKEVVKGLINLPQNNFLDEIKEENSIFVKMPKLIGYSKEKAMEILTKKNIKYNLIENNPTGIVINQYPKHNTSFDNSETVTMILGERLFETKSDVTVMDYSMPDLIGLTIREAVQKTFQRQIKLLINGRGVIISQSIPPGASTKFGEKCVVKAKL